MASQPISILITGANRGLGLEMVEQILQASQPVKQLFACCRDPDGPQAEALRTLAKKHADVVSIVRLDASDLRSIRRATQRVGAALPPGGLNLLINNAAVLPRGGLQTTSPEDMQSALHTNVLGPANIIKEFLPLLRAAVRAGGRAGMSCRQAAVVNISAFLGSFPSIEETYDFLPAISYRMSKAALNMLTLCASTELKRDGILVAALHPGWVRTDMGTQEELADIDARESVEGMLDVVFSLNEKDTGTFLNYKGKVIGW